MDAIVLIAFTLLSSRQLIVRMNVNSISHSKDNHQLLLDASAHSYLNYTWIPYTDLHLLALDNKVIYTRKFRNNTRIIKIIPSLILVQKYAGHKKDFIYSLTLLFSLSKASFVVN